MAQSSEVVRPEYVDLENNDERLTIRWRWSGPLGRRLLFLTLIIPLYSVLCGLLPPILTLTGMTMDWKGVATSFCFPPLGFALFFSYYLLANHLNQTQVTVDKKEIRVQYRPLPWGGNVRWAVNDVTQLYVVNQYPIRLFWGGRYAVRVILSHKTHLNLLTGLYSVEHAHFIEQEIEKYLGIVDRPVRGSAAG